MNILDLVNNYYWSCSQKRLMIKVLDKDWTDSDGIGKTKFNFGHLAVGQSQDVELNLYAHKLDLTSNGKLYIRVTRRF